MCVYISGIALPAPTASAEVEDTNAVRKTEDAVYQTHLVQ